MYASVAMLQALVPRGGHIVTTTDCYRKTRVFIQNELPKKDISVQLLHLLSLAFGFHVILLGSERSRHPIEGSSISWSISLML